MPYAGLGVVAIILVATTYKAIRGNKNARIFLWVWAICVGALLPFADRIGQRLSAPAMALAAATTIPYLLLLFGRRNQSLEETQKQLRRVLAESSRRSDDERRRITQRLHDDISPRIVLAKIDLQQLSEIVASGIEDGEARMKAEEIIGRTLDAMATTYKEIRDLGKNTRIEMIASVGLVAAVESLVQHYQGALERPEIVLQTKLRNALKLPEAVAINAYRIIEEALLNAVRHADATTITIRMERQNDKYSVEVADNGKGLPSETGRGIGLVDLRERARMLATELKISSTRQRGTTISFVFAAQVPPDAS